MRPLRMPARPYAPARPQSQLQLLPQSQLQPQVSGERRCLPALLPARSPARSPVRPAAGLPVRLAAVMVAVTAAATGCVSVGDGDAHRVAPSHSAGQPGGPAPDGMSAESGGGRGFGLEAGGDGKHTHAGKRRPKDAKDAKSPSAQEADGVPAAVPVEPGSSVRATPTAPAPSPPTRAPAPPTESAAPPTEAPAPSSSPPPPAEPSSSAHEGTGPQLADRVSVPAPAAGTPAYAVPAAGSPVASPVPLTY